MLKKQVIEGVPYACEELPRFSTPEQIFKYFKARTIYKSDPKDTELFMTLPTFLNKNYHNIPGAGDCDDFTIALLTALIANGFFDCGIVLVGRNRLNAVHIYCYCDDKGERKYLDLTNAVPLKERSYPYRQELYFPIDKNLKQKIKTMNLQLAENSVVPSLGYNPYVYLPSKGVQVREDMLDTLPLKEFTNSLSEEGYTGDQIAELSARRAKRASTPKQPSARKQSKTSKNIARETKAQARLVRAQQGGPSGFDTAISGITKVIDSSGKVIKAYKGQPTPENEVEVNPETGDVTDTSQGPASKDSGKILGMPKKTAYWVGGGLLLLAVIGGVKMTRKRK